LILRAGGADRSGARRAAARAWRLVVLLVLIGLVGLIVLIDLIRCRAGVAVDRLAAIVAVLIPRRIGVRLAVLLTAAGRNARVDADRAGWWLIGVTAIGYLRRLPGAIRRALRARTAGHTIAVADL